MAKYITNNALKNTFFRFTSVLKNWLPIKKKDEKTIIQTPNYKDIIEIDIDGNVYIIGLDDSRMNLKNELERCGTFVVEYYDDILSHEDSKNLGRLFYVRNSSTDHIAGLYVMGIGLNGKLCPYKIGETTGSTADVGTRVDSLENWVKNGYLKDQEILDIIK
jgi:hypothetical protein